MNVFSLKVMVLFLWGFLLANPCIVFQRVCVFCLLSQCVSRYSLHMSDLWVCMRDVISEFNSEIEGSLAFCVLMLFLCSILCIMCFGSGLHVECCCLPTPMTLASGGSPMFPLVVHQPASPFIWPAVQSLQRGLSTNSGATMWCVCR